MTSITNALDDDEFEIFDDEAGMFRGHFLDDLVDETTAVEHFGPDYRLALISVADMQAFIRPRFIPPLRPLDIEFSQFCIHPECLSHININNEILDDVGGLALRFEWYCEVDEDVTEEWLCTYIDEEIALRHIPLLPTHTGAVYFHAFHLDAFLSHIFKMKDGHQIFGKDRYLKDATLWCEYEF